MKIPGRVETVEQLEVLYREPSERALDKERAAIDDGMAALIDHSPFLVLATSNGAGSLDASPRGGPPGFVRRLDDRHIAIPDLNGNNRLDSYRNLIAHPWAGVLMIVPGKDETLRINGPAVITVDRDILDGFTKELRPPKAAIVVETAEIYGHCAKAFRRGKMWDPDAWAVNADAPDLAAMYACSWSLDEDEMRGLLDRLYDSDLAAD
ncbi:MAG: MSMEG_1061 family FMN-dependent PPOX-type flavoprotein [Ilumatobacteraceae bacterium]